MIFDIILIAILTFEGSNSLEDRLYGDDDDCSRELECCRDNLEKTDFQLDFCKDLVGKEHDRNCKLVKQLKDCNSTVQSQNATIIQQNITINQLNSSLIACQNRNVTCSNLTNHTDCNVLDSNHEGRFEAIGNCCDNQTSICINGQCCLNNNTCRGKCCDISSPCAVYPIYNYDQDSIHSNCCVFNNQIVNQGYGSPISICCKNITKSPVVRTCGCDLVCVETLSIFITCDNYLYTSYTFRDVPNC